jgi:hypothetical protein
MFRSYENSGMPKDIARDCADPQEDHCRYVRGTCALKAIGTGIARESEGRISAPYSNAAHLGRTQT